MRKLLSILVLGLLMQTADAQAMYAPPVLAETASGAGGPAFIPFAGALDLAMFVIYANANGIPFPLCGVSGLNCYAQYPTGKNGQ